MKFATKFEWHYHLP